MSRPEEQPNTAHAEGARAPETPFRYGARLADELERRWQAEWERAGTFVQPNPGEPGFERSRPKFYCLDMFPYPSGAGLHVGHPEGYTATDIISRYKRMKGFNVLHPMGWDAFGLPAEQYAIQTGVHPAITTRQAIDNFRRQLKRFGFSYDWSREFGTIDPEYYKWTQWIFLKLYDSWFDPVLKKARAIKDLEREFATGVRTPCWNPHEAAAGIARFGDRREPPEEWSSLFAYQQRQVLDSYRLAYLGTTTVNWCPKLGTVLANDEVIDGRSERGGFPVLRKPMKQWMFRITAYADRLAHGLTTLDWPASTKAMQTEWIGRSEGADIQFVVKKRSEPLAVFTTRPDTLFGATYMVVAPEHPMVQEVLGAPPPGADAAAVRAYVERARNLSDIERMENKQKTGVFSGVHAINPATGSEIPVWIADYVLMGYGTGAIMAVPAHDERDFEFAQTFALPIRDVVYDRTRLAMAYFAAHAQGSGQREDQWQGVLADFLGLVTTQNSTEEGFAPILAQVSRERGESGTAVVIHLGETLEDRPGAIGARRGSTQVGWIDFLDEQKFTSFQDFSDRFTSGMFFARRGEAYSGSGTLVNSSADGISLDGLATEEAKVRMTSWLEHKGIGRGVVRHRLRDWTFSRQRYWGEPIPIVFDDEGNHYPATKLPVELPALADYAPIEHDDPQPLLAKAADWVKTTAGEAGVPAELLDPRTPVRRECNTMPGSAGSSWYASRYCDARNSGAFVSPEADKYWMGKEKPGGVDLYLGGSEHAVGHLLYARFWHMVLHDLGYLGTPEPFQKLFHQGLITSYAYQRADKVIVPVDEVREVSEGAFELIATGERVTPVVTKMSKRYKNVINPDEVIAEFGADTFRLYEMYMGPLDASKPWNPRDITGLFRFLQRFWRVAMDEATGNVRAASEPDAKMEKLLHRAIAKVGSDIENFAFNTAIAAMIQFVNECSPGCLSKDQLGRAVRMISPFAPHLSEEVWHAMGHATMCSLETWPSFDGAMLRDDEVELAVQVGGKVRCKIVVATGAESKVVEEIALAHAEVQRALAGKSVKKIIVVPGRLVNIVAG